MSDKRMLTPNDKKKMGFLDKDKNSTETELICDMISPIPNPA